jgi:Cytochrome P460
MLRAMACVLAVLVSGSFCAWPKQKPADSSIPRYSQRNQLIRPEGYREWIYLSTGLGMAYSPNPNAAQTFTNVFVPQAAYRAFVATGKWPEKTMFVLEERATSSKGSINKSGHFQTNLEGLAVEVKDSSHFPETWAYFTFGSDDKTASSHPKAACWQCHDDNGAVEHTFVQFYPTLKPVAIKFGVYKTKE